MAYEVRTPERIIAEIASASHGIATRGELLGAGLTPHQIATRVGKGALIVVHRGVYRAGHCAPSRDASFMAAVRAGGEGALLSGLSAAALLGLVDRPPHVVQVLASTERRLPVRVTRARRGGSGDAFVWHGIPVTSIARTLIDIAPQLGDEDLARAVHRAATRYRTIPADVERVLARRPSSPGAARLRAVLRGDVKVTLSELERRFLSLLRARDLPLPQTNRRAGAHRVDCRWPAHRLTVELDSYRYHNSRYSWEQDRWRERAARVRGDQHRRYTHDDVLEDPGSMLRELESLLSAEPS